MINFFFINLILINCTEEKDMTRIFYILTNCELIVKMDKNNVEPTKSFVLHA